MSDYNIMTQRDKDALDRHITGNYGEDQMTEHTYDMTEEINTPPNKRDLEYSALVLEAYAKTRLDPANIENRVSVLRVAELCKQLVPALEQFGPFVEQLMRAQSK